MMFVNVRPMVRQGRVVMPMSEQSQSATWTVWRNAAILKQGLLEASDVQSSKDLLIIEDMSEETLPSTTSLTHSIGVAERYHQLGHNAFSAVLKGSLADLSSGATKPTLVVDLGAHTGDLLRATVQEKFKKSLPGIELYYIGFQQDSVEARQSLDEAVMVKLI